MTTKNRSDWAGRERRRSARVDAKVALKLSGAGTGLPSDSVTTESINVGAEGIYCFVPHFVAPLTKLQVTMVLPVRAKRSQVRNEVMNTEAVVVRCQPAGKEGHGFRIACFFSSLSPEARAVLEEYVRQHEEEP